MSPAGTGVPSGVLRIGNDSLEVEIDADLGAEVRAIRRPGGPNLLAAYDWSAPLPARRSTSYGDPELDWLSEYRGGWQELFPNAGDACTVGGVPLPFHGEVSRARWDVTDRRDDRVTLRTSARLPLVLERRMWVTNEPPALRVEETVCLDAPLTVPFLMGHHPAFPATEGAHIDLPSGSLVTVDEGYVTDLMDLAPAGRGTWPAVPGRDGGSVHLDTVGAGPVQRLAYLSGFGPEPWAAIRGVASGAGVAMAWDATTYPCAWFWWEIGGPGHPWHGRARIVAIEPNTAFPSRGLAAARERGEAHTVTPGGEHRTWITMSAFDADERPVTHVARDGRVSR